MAEKCTEIFSQLFVGILKIHQFLRNFNSSQIEKPFNLKAIRFLNREAHYLSKLCLYRWESSFREVLRWPDNNSMFRRLSYNRATSRNDNCYDIGEGMISSGSTVE
jgi:hypothetical protein